MSSAVRSKRERPRILSLEVTDGFLAGLKIEFREGHNCVIGPRGSGKSTIVEFLRYALQNAGRGAAAKRRGAPDQVQANLRAGRIAVTFQARRGGRYRVERALNEHNQLYTLEGSPLPFAGDTDNLFRADIYSQNEIEQIAANPRQQLQMLDRFAEPELRALEAELRRVAGQLTSIEAELLEVENRVHVLHEQVREHEALLQRLATLHPASLTQPHEDTLLAFHAAAFSRTAYEEITLEAAADDLDRFENEVAGRLRSFARQLGRRIDRRIQPSSPTADSLRPVMSKLTSIVDAIDDAAAELAASCRATAEQVRATQTHVRVVHAAERQKYVELSNRFGDDERTAERIDLVQRLARITTAQSELDACEEEHAQKREARGALLLRLFELRDRRTAIREKVTAKISAALSEMVKVSILPSADRTAYRELLEEALKGCNFKYGVLADKIAATILPWELSKYIEKDDADAVATLADIPLERAARVLSVLRTSLVRVGLDRVDVEDCSQIEFRDGPSYKPIGELSTGQQCTAILPILLLDQERPLIVDQPEDNLDNAFVYDMIRSHLHKASQSRQIIFITHNPNIPVLGEAERVFVMRSTGTAARVAAQGSVDDVRKDIETLLEGGRVAFTRRMERYGHK